MEKIPKLLACGATTDSPVRLGKKSCLLSFFVSYKPSATPFVRPYPLLWRQVVTTAATRLWDNIACGCCCRCGKACVLVHLTVNTTAVYRSIYNRHQHGFTTDMKIPVVLESRWGLQPVIVVSGSSGDEGGSPLPLEETGSKSKPDTKPTSPIKAPATTAAGSSPFSISCECGDDGREGGADDDEDEDDIDDEPTGRTLWDCAQVLWDLVADPNPANMFSVKGKVCTAPPLLV